MITGLNHITLAVKNLDTSVDFYLRVLGCKLHARWDGGAYLSIAGIWLCLSLDTPIATQDYSHLAFSVSEADLPLMKQRFSENGVRIWKENKSEGESVYFLDPDGHKLELHAGDL